MKTDKTLYSTSNTIEGFEKLQRWIEGIQQKHRLSNVIIGMEPTGPPRSIRIANRFERRQRDAIVRAPCHPIFKNDNAFLRMLAFDALIRRVH
jgi:transposase